MLRLVREAESHAARGRLNLAIEKYEAALAAGAGSAEVLNRLGGLYLGTGAFARSAGTFRRSLREKPGQLEVYKAIGEALLADGKLDSAISCIEEARQLAPQASSIRSSLGFLYMQAGRGALAKSQLDSALILDARNPEAHRFLGFYHTRMDSLEAAIRSYEQLTVLLPNDVEAFNNLAFLHGQKKQYSRSLDYYKRAKELAVDPNLVHAINLNIEAIRGIMSGKLRARMILVESETQGRDLLKRLSEGEPFVDLAARFSKAPNARDGGDLGFFGPGDMVAEVERAVLQLEVGETSGIIRLKQGVMILERLN